MNACKILRNFLKSQGFETFKILTVWSCKALKNYKYIMTTTLHNGEIYEVTYNGTDDVWYIDAYAKYANVEVRESCQDKQE